MTTEAQGTPHVDDDLLCALPKPFMPGRFRLRSNLARPCWQRAAVCF
jgi:hypothetical protein